MPPPRGRDANIVLEYILAALGGGAGISVDVTDRIGRLLGRISNYDVLVNGTLAALNQTVEMDASGLSTIGLGISGAGWVGTIVAEITVGDGVWEIVPMIDQLTGAAIVSTAINGNWLLGIGGALRLRIRAFAWAAGTATIYLEGTSATSGVFLSRSIPTGINVIGRAGIDQTTPGTTNKVWTDPTTATPTSYNVTCTVADTEYSQAMPANCRFFEFQARTEAVLRYAFVTGKVAGPVAPYHTLKAGDYYYSPSLNQDAAPSTLYLASPIAGTVAEILAWT